MAATLDPDHVGRAVAAGLATFEARHPACRAAHERGRRSMPNGVAMSWFATLYGHPPLVVEEGDGHHFTCSDGLTYLDMGLAIVSAFAGYRHPAIVAAVERQLRRGTQFTMAGPDDARLTEELARRWRLPAWQLTLGATAAVSEAIRAARAMTGRPDVLAFEGKYHGFHDELLVLAEGDRLVPEYLGLAPGAGLATRLVPFNDLAAAAAALEDGRVAAAIVEPAILNTRTILPDPDFHAGLRRLTRDAGALLIVDETYTLTMAFGGLTGAWALEPDIVTLGKSLGGGIPLGAWGMTDPVRRFLEAPAGTAIGFGDVQFVGRPIAEVGTGSTFAGTPHRGRRGYLPRGPRRRPRRARIDVDSAP